MAARTSPGLTSPTPLHPSADRRGAGVGSRLAAMGGVLLIGNLATWAGALATFRGNALLTGTALLAYGFGLKHAFDADHIAAIDNVTRRLIQRGERPVAVGFFFSLGHSTVVFALSAAIAATASTLGARLDPLKRVGGVFGTVVSSGFLFAIALANGFVLRSVWREFRRVRGGAPAGEHLDLAPAAGGLFTRLLGRVFRLVDRSWHMYPLGLLFGLGFDTATEIGLLALSATVAAKGMPLWSILLYPALFTAGMSLLDTLDGVLMVGAYRWAFVEPARRLTYNLAMTFVSVLAAIAIGGLEILGLLGQRLALKGPFWQAVAGVDAHFGLIGCGIVGLFLGGWVVSAAIDRSRRFDEWGAAAAAAEAPRSDGF